MTNPIFTTTFALLARGPDWDDLLEGALTGVGIGALIVALTCFLRKRRESWF